MYFHVCYYQDIALTNESLAMVATLKRLPAAQIEESDREDASDEDPVILLSKSMSYLTMNLKP